MDFSRFFRELFGLFLLFWALFLLLALLSFDANDPSVNVVKSGVTEVGNRAGMFGAYASGFLNDIFGIGALCWPFVFAFLGVTYLSSKFYMHWWRWCGIFLLTLCLLAISSAFDIYIGDLNGGGIVGDTLYYKSNHYLSPAGSWLLWIFVFLTGTQLTANFSWVNFYRNILDKIKKWFLSRGWQNLPKISLSEKCRNFFSGMPAKFLALKKILFSRFYAPGSKEDLLLPEMPAENSAPQHGQVTVLMDLPDDQENVSKPILPPVNNPVPFFSQEESKEEISIKNNDEEWEADFKIEDNLTDEPELLPDWPDEEPVEKKEASACLVLPSVDLLQPASPKEDIHEDLEARGRALVKCFEDYDIHGQLARIIPGPVVTMFEVRPDPGIRISRISNLCDELSLALKAVAVRIQAPIPGSDTVGIEIPNEIREVVNFRELVESDEFQKGAGPLTMILGRNISGRPYMADLSRMPHLLVAGATGAGKSVCLNSILVSLLYKLQPDDMRLLLVDPKRVEMAVYSDLPHLVHPVVTDMNDAKNALDWATHEMDNRFDAMKRLGARNITAYNQKLLTMGSKRPDELKDLEHFPYLVIVIDELADLMMTAAREVQTSIVRLAQLARAAGIHMILATQRPSVDVVTGQIKANFLNRISFQVTSKYDSRTILDQSGAEYLLGKGDMLYKPSAGKLIRLHGPFLSDEEVQLVANHLKSQRQPEYDIDFSRWNPDSRSNSDSDGDMSTDKLYEEAKAFIIEQGHASISQLQRSLQIGFARAGRIIDQLERDGVVGPANGSKPRQVIRH